METTPGRRVQMVREAKGYKSITAFAEFTGLKIGTLSALEGDKSAPSLETLARLNAAFPDVSMEWLISGTGSMLRDGRALTPTPRAAEPAPDYTSAAGTIDATVNLLLKEQLSEARERAAADRATIAWLQAELGKSPGSSEAAGHYAPIPPRQPAGFNQAARAIAFNAYIEAQLEEAGALVSR